MFQYAHDCYARRQRPTIYIHLWRFLVGLSSLEACFYEEGRADMIDTRDGVLLDKAVEPEPERRVGGAEDGRVPDVTTGFMRCTATHQFSDERLGRIRQCSLPAGHSDRRHLTEDDRWWESFGGQQQPRPNDSTPILDLVIADLRGRDDIGRVKYGTTLQAGNGRDALRDAYEEALDLAMYLRKELEERMRASHNPKEP